MSKLKTTMVIVRAVQALHRSRNEMHINHRLNASGTGARRNRKCYCRKAKHRLDHRSEV